MADLAKYGEVVDTPFDDVATRALSEGWELIAAKIVEEQRRVNRAGEEPHIEKKGVAYYILGKRRDYRSPEQRKKDLELREEHDR